MVVYSLLPSSFCSFIRGTYIYFYIVFIPFSYSTISITHSYGLEVIHFIVFDQQCLVGEDNDCLDLGEVTMVSHLGDHHPPMKHWVQRQTQQ